MIDMTREAYRRILSASTQLQLLLHDHATEVAIAEGADFVEARHIEQVLRSPELWAANVVETDLPVRTDDVHRRAG